MAFSSGLSGRLGKSAGSGPLHVIALGSSPQFELGEAEGNDGYLILSGRAIFLYSLIHHHCLLMTFLVSCIDSPNFLDQQDTRFNISHRSMLEPLGNAEDVSDLQFDSVSTFKLNPEGTSRDAVYIR